MKKRQLVIHYNAPVVLSFALLSLIVLGLDFLTGGATTTKFFCVYRSSFSDPLTYVRLFGHVLGHSGYSHYISNIMLMLVVGTTLEDKYGSKKLMFCILITALLRSGADVPLPFHRPAGRQRHRVHDDRAGLPLRHEEQLHSPDSHSGGHPLFGRRAVGCHYCP